MSKVLDKNAYNYAREQHDLGVPYKEVAEELNKMGYSTPTGLEIRQDSLSHFMITHGYRVINKRNFKRKHNKGTDTATTKVTAPRFKLEGFMLDTIASTALTPEQKVKVLQALL